jgi:hypothetical protein
LKLTKEQKAFLNKVCFSRRIGVKWKLNSNGEVDVVEGKVDMSGMGLTEIPVKFGRVDVNFICSENQLTTLKNCPTSIGGNLLFGKNNLTDYFKSIKEEDFPHWDKLVWGMVLLEYPFLVNIGKKYFDRSNLEFVLDCIPQTKLYYKD